MYSLVGELLETRSDSSLHIRHLAHHVAHGRCSINVGERREERKRKGQREGERKGESRHLRKNRNSSWQRWEPTAYCLKSSHSTTESTSTSNQFCIWYAAEQCSQCSSPLGYALKSSGELLSNVWVWDARPTSLARGGRARACAALTEKSSLPISTEAVPSRAPTSHRGEVPAGKPWSRSLPENREDGRTGPGGFWGGGRGGGAGGGAFPWPGLAKAFLLWVGFFLFRQLTWGLDSQEHQRNK